jgi:phage shock protein A
MNLLERISNLITANINYLLDKAEDPEVMVKQLIRDMEGSIIELRRETVRAVAREKQIQKQIKASADLIEELEGKAKLALKAGDEKLARSVLGRKLQSENTKATLEKELQLASETAEQLKSDLSRLEDQAQSARRKKETLVRQKRQAEEKLRSKQAAKRSVDALNATRDSLSGMSRDGGPIDSLASSIHEVESMAEAEREMLNRDIQNELDLQKLAEESAIDEELERLKEEL